MKFVHLLYFAKPLSFIAKVPGACTKKHYKSVIYGKMTNL
jgi:hypothetical protein